jgi:hypothetical protein
MSGYYSNSDNSDLTQFYDYNDSGIGHSLIHQGL